MEILVFKTDIANRWHLTIARKIFNNLHGILEWNVDVEDIDHVLRVEAINIPPTVIERELLKAGYYCEEKEELQRSLCLYQTRRFLSHDSSHGQRFNPCGVDAFLTIA